MYRHRLIQRNKCTTLMQMLTEETEEGEGIYGNSLYFQLDFSLNLKLL